VDLSGNSDEQWFLEAQGFPDAQLKSLVETIDGGALLKVDLRLEDASYKDRTQLLLRIDPDGRIVWEHYYAGDLLQATEDGGALIHDGRHLVKLNSDGQVVWEKEPTLDGPGVTYQLSYASELPDGGLILSGQEIDWVPPTPNPARAGTYELGTTALWFARFSATDQLEWKRNLELPLRFQRVPYGSRADGGVVVTSPLRTFDGCRDPLYEVSTWVLSLAPDGGIAFAKEYLQLVRLFGFTPTSDGGLLLYGEGPALIRPEGDCNPPMLIKVDTDGILQWSRVYRPEGGITSAVELEDGSILISWAFWTNADLNGMLIRLDSEGRFPNCEVFWSDEQYMPAGPRSPGWDRGAGLKVEMGYPAAFLEPQAPSERSPWEMLTVDLDATTWCRTLW
jgi:hypothetical protein